MVGSRRSLERVAALSEAKGACERGNSGDDCRRSLICKHV